MRGWRPRLPSPNLKAQLFASTLPSTPGAPTPSPQAHTWAWLGALRWWAPACAAGLLALLSLEVRLDDAALDRPASGHLAFAAVAFSNQLYAAYLPGPGHSHLNASERTTFRWTNRSGFPSSMPSSAAVATNHLR